MTYSHTDDNSHYHHLKRSLMIQIIEPLTMYNTKLPLVGIFHNRRNIIEDTD
jgi:hypothetical protein